MGGAGGALKLMVGAASSGEPPASGGAAVQPGSRGDTSGLPGGGALK